MGIYCEASFNYLDGFAFAPRTMPVRNGRDDQPGFVDAGFERIDAPSAVADWTDAAHVDVVHGPEVATFMRERFDPDHVLVYPTLVRSPKASAVEADYAPIESVHSDFSSDYRRMIWEPERPYRAFLDPMLAAAGLSTDDLRDAGRVAVFQTWRNVGPVIADRPLAFCDARSIPADRIVHYVVPDYGGQRLDFETSLATAPASGDTDDWYVFPELHDDEAVLLRTYDSAEDDAGRPYWTMHSAFVDPHVAQTEAHRRESVEMRALLVWS